MKKKKGQLSLVSFGAEGQSNLNDHELEEYAPLEVEE